MRMLYLIRHARPAGDLSHRCISATDTELDPIGVLQAQRLHRWAAGVQLTAVYTSPYQRCVQTAQILTADRWPIWERVGLREMHVGAWENLTFDEIRVRWPREYAARGRHPGTIPPPGGESFYVAGRRLGSCIRAILGESSGNIAVVAHGGVNRGWLCGLLGGDWDAVLSIRQPWGGISAIQVDDTGTCTPLTVGEQPDRVPPPEIQAYLLDKYRTPAPVIAHGRAVAQKALELAGQLRDVPLDWDLLGAAAVLHDLARAGTGDHAEQGAAFLDREGYPAVAAIVARHHDLGADPTPEAALLYLADKLVQGEQTVTLEARFAASRKKCDSPEAIAAWERRYGDARALMQRYHLKETV